MKLPRVNGASSDYDPTTPKHLDEAAFKTPIGKVTAVKRDKLDFNVQCRDLIKENADEEDLQTPFLPQNRGLTS